MHSNIRLVISFAIACVGCLVAALLALPATAGTIAGRRSDPSRTRLRLRSIPRRRPRSMRW